MIPKRHRLLLGLAAALLALIVLGGLLQAIRTLLWDLGYFLPGWLITPLLLLRIALIAVMVMQVELPWWRQIRHRSASRRSDASQEVPTTRRDVAGRSLIALIVCWSGWRTALCGEPAPGARTGGAEPCPRRSCGGGVWHWIERQNITDPCPASGHGG